MSIACTHAHTHTCTHTHTHAHIHTHMHTRTHMHTYTHTCTHTHTHAHIHTQMHGIAHSYVTVTEIQASSPGQLSLVQDQPVKIIDSKRSDWWLVSTIPVDDSLSSSVQEGWVPANQLAPAPRKLA